MLGWGLPTLFQCLYYLLAEWRERQGSQLEVLHTERNAHDGDAEEQTYQRMRHRHLKTATHNPKQIEQHRPAAHLAASVHDLVPKRRERQQSQLEQLHTYGNADDGDAIQKAKDEIEGSHQKTAKDEPDEIS